MSPDLNALYIVKRQGGLFINTKTELIVSLNLNMLQIGDENSCQDPW